MGRTATAASWRQANDMETVMPDNIDDYRFFPRADAHRTCWGDLLLPVRGAVRELLMRVSGAVDKVKESHHDDSDEDDIANCFLVYGERGTGKTTVLLNVAEAIDNNTKFFPSDDGSGLIPSAQCAATNLADNCFWSWPATGWMSTPFWNVPTGRN
jgi:hypothetical protein